MAVVTLECAGVLEGEKAMEILSHVEAVWERGQQAVKLLRQELPAESVDVMAPLRNGGVHLHKLFGVMHDTCHAANKVAPLLLPIISLLSCLFIPLPNFLRPKLPKILSTQSHLLLSNPHFSNSSSHIILPF